jgi:ferredoxin-type protein NapG
MSSDPRKRESRRKFLLSAAVGAGAVCFSLAGFLPVELRRTPRLRPPGALDEADFLASCIKCGQCVQVCPVAALKPAELDDGFGVGVPFYEPRQQACDFSCDVGQCILACPTGALTYHRPATSPASLSAPPVLLARVAEPDPTLSLTQRMGLARLVRPQACLSVQGLGVNGPARGERFAGRKRWPEVDRWVPQRVREHAYALERCDLCVRECPIQGAISIEQVAGAATPTVHAACVGCGVCEMMCPVDEPCIVVKAEGAPS